MNGAIGPGVFVLCVGFAKEVVSGPPGSCFGFGQVGAVGFDGQNHVAGRVADDGVVGIACCVVEELSELGNGTLGGLVLLGGERIECREHGKVHSASVEEEHTNDHLLDEFFPNGFEGFSGVRAFGVLNACSIVGPIPTVWGIFSLGRLRVNKALEGLFDVTGEGDVTGAFGIIPV